MKHIEIPIFFRDIIILSLTDRSRCTQQRILRSPPPPLKIFEQLSRDLYNIIVINSGLENVINNLVQDEKRFKYFVKL